ncbi:OLC1v1033293C2 [Oldenlandia corymbosa var. corymbosa]|nr:OLC1v1033293C2 [Oldenlandia corymbosa var. corymbosa]
MQELGPFLVHNNNANLTLNKFSWNKEANMIFLEAPVGVGFSYSNKSEDINNLGDAVTARDSYDFLLGWFKRFPNFRSHDFYIAGESYAGHYVPQLADLIYEKNKGATKDSIINLKGFLIGNAVINDPTDQLGFVDYAWSHAIISDQLHSDINKDCDFKSNTSSSQCTMHIRGFLQAYSNIDIYNIYAPVCLTTSFQKKKISTLHRLRGAPRFFTKNVIWEDLPSGYDPCTEEYVETYFNREDVQKAIHANLTKLSYPYTPCSNVITKWNDSPDTVLPTLQKLLNAGLRVWVFSGDTDGRVPVTSTRYSINAMGLTVKEGWRAWFLDNKQVGGWVESYDQGLTFLTVRGAGHQVPMFAPHQSLLLFSHFLKGTSLPSSI